MNNTEYRHIVENTLVELQSYGVSEDQIRGAHPLLLTGSFNNARHLSPEVTEAEIEALAHALVLDPDWLINRDYQPSAEYNEANRRRKIIQLYPNAHIETALTPMQEIRQLGYLKRL